MKVLYHITGAITFVNEIPWVVEPIYLAQVCFIFGLCLLLSPYLTYGLFVCYILIKSSNKLTIF